MTLKPLKPVELSYAALLLVWGMFLVAAWNYYAEGTHLSGDMLQMDAVTLLFMSVALLLGTLVILVSSSEFAPLVLLLIAACAGLTSTTDLFNLWMWFEGVSVISYLLIFYARPQPAPLLATINYLVQNAVGSVCILMGIALVLAATGSLDQKQVLPAESAQLASILLITGFGVKTALVPLHTWLPDAYTQASSQATVLLAALATPAGLLALLRALTFVDNASLGSFLIGAGFLNLVIGNFLAFRHRQIKRILAYSSLPHIGIMLLGMGVAYETGALAGAQGSLLHLFNHSLMKGLAFLAVGALLHVTSEAEDSTLRDLAGAARRYPLVGLALATALFSLAGIPPLAGFVSLFQVLGAGLASDNTLIQSLIVIATLSEIIAVAYYLNIVNTLVLQPPSLLIQRGRALPWHWQIPLLLLALLILAMGLYPEMLLWLIEPAAEALVGG